MSFLDNLGNIVSNVSDSLGKIKNTVNGFFTNILDFGNPIHDFPKIELITRKYKIDKSNQKKIRINDYVNKYCISNLNKVINSLPNSDKANIYSIIGEKLFIVSLETTYISNFANELSTKYYERALDLLPENLELAYKLFNVYNRDSLRGRNKRGVEVAQLCLKLSNNNIKIESDSIYYYIGEYYYHSHKNYKKALEYFQKALVSAEPFSFYYNQSKEYLAYTYDKLGQYKTSLEFIESVIKAKGENISNNIYEFRDEIKKKIDEGLTKEEEDSRIFKANMNYYFNNSVGLHPEEILTEAYKTYLNAENLTFQNKYTEAIEEYKKVKKLLPEQNLFIYDKIKRVKELIKDEKTNKDSEELIKILNEKLEIALKTGKNLCNTYNELGIAYSGLKEYNKAIDFFRKAIDISANPSVTYYNLAKCYEKMELYDEAISTYEKIKMIDSKLAVTFKIDYLITCINDKKEGRFEKNVGKNSIELEHYNKGNDVFDFSDYEKAFKEFNAAYESDKNNINYIFRMILVKDFYETLYYEEKELCLKAIKACEKNDDFNYLPFFFTIIGDSVSYREMAQSKAASVFYELAIYLLNMVPIKQRFAAPYYKLSILKEQEREFNEALSLLKQANEIDSSYKIDSDVKRILSQLKDGGINNKEIENDYLKLLKKHLENHSYNDLITEGLKALDYAPYNLQIYYLICQAAEKINRYYELKWAAMEGLHVDSHHFGQSDNSDYLLYILGMCCKYEQKIDEAYNIFNSIVGDEDPLRPDEIVRKAFEQKMIIEQERLQRNRNL